MKYICIYNRYIYICISIECKSNFCCSKLVVLYDLCDRSDYSTHGMTIISVVHTNIVDCRNYVNFDCNARV